MTEQLDLKKPNICSKDITKCAIRCPKCELTKRCHSKLFYTPQSLWRHLWQSHSFDRNDYPTNTSVIEILDIITFALHSGISLHMLEQPKKWKMILDE